MTAEPSVRPPPWSSAGYRPDIDGLRAVSIITVVLFHAFPQVEFAGFVGVDVFFVISGFLIGGLISSELAAGTFSFGAFYARRVRRIFPALLVVVAVVWALGWWAMYPAEFRQLGRHIGAAAVFVSNFVLLDEIVGYFTIDSHGKPLLHLWSLAIEEQFYLLWPLFAFLLRGRRTLFLALTGLLLAGSFAANVAEPFQAAAFYAPWTRFWELAAGVLLSHAPQLEIGKALRQAMCALGLAMIVLAACLVDKQTFPGWWALLPVLGAVLAIAAGPDTWAGRHVLASPPMVFVGRISYPLYLWHWPLFAFAWLAYGTFPPGWVAWPLIAASVLLAWLTYEYVEKPIRFGARRRGAIAALAVSFLGLGAVGLVTLHLDGVPSRAVAEANRSRAEDIRVPDETRRSDGSCRTRYGIDTGEAFVCTVNAERPRLLFVGDSVSMAFYAAIYSRRIEASSAMVGAHSFNWGRPDCLRPGPLDVWLKGSEVCQTTLRTALALLAREKSIEALVLPTYAYNPFFSDKTRLAELQQMVAALGRKLIYVASPPQFYRPPGGCWPRRLTLFGLDVSRAPDIDACRQSRTDIEAGLAGQRALFAEMVKVSPGTALFDSLPSFCDAQYCYQSDSDGALYWTWAHVNERGSLRVLKDFLPWVAKRLGPS